MKPLDLGYPKINMCLTFCMLYCLENTELTEYRICRHTCYKPRTSRRRILVAHRKLDTSQSHIDNKDYSCLQRLLNTWHGIIHMMWWMKWWCTLIVMKFRNILIGCIIGFQWNLGTCVLSYVQISSTHSSHLMLPILIGWQYLRFITCH
jgi:hypothetical protein